MNANIYLKFPFLGEKEEWLAYVKEMREENKTATPGGFKEDTIYEEWLQKIKNERENKNLEKGRVPSSFYFLMKENRILGSISIRHSIDSDMLSRFSGHIGYNVRPNERRKGYATQMLFLALEKCRELGLDKVMVTCKKGNIASAKTIENNFGVLTEEIYVPEEDDIFKKYWINVEETLIKKQ